VPAILEAEPENVYAHATYRSLAERWDDPWQQILRRGEDRGDAAGTFHLYRVPPTRASSRSLPQG